MQVFQPKGRRYLVIARVGDRSLHPQWLEPSIYRNFDLCLNYFGEVPGLYSDQCDFYIQSGGVNFCEIKKVVEALGDTITQYEAVWIPDDDLSADAGTISRMFEIFTEQQFILAQPALTPNSPHTHPMTIQRPEYRWRYAYFIEAMAPIFTIPALQTCLPTFDQSYSAYGIDNIWPHLLGYPPYKMAIIDETPIWHTREIGTSPFYATAEQMSGMNRMEELSRILDQYGVVIDPSHFNHYDGVLREQPAISASPEPASELAEAPVQESAPEPVPVRKSGSRRKKKTRTLKRRLKKKKSKARTLKARRKKANRPVKRKKRIPVRLRRKSVKKVRKTKKLSRKRKGLRVVQGKKIGSRPKTRSLSSVLNKRKAS